MTINKKNSAGRGKKKASGNNVSEDVATTSSTLDVAGVTTSTSTSAVESIEKSSSMTSTTSKISQETRKATEAESRSSVVEVTSGSREYVMDSKGNVIRVIEHPPTTSSQSSRSSRLGKSSQDFISGEQTQLVIEERKSSLQEQINITSSDVGARESTSARKISGGNDQTATLGSSETIRQQSHVTTRSDIREDVATSSETSIVESSTSIDRSNLQDSSVRVEGRDPASLTSPNIRMSNTSSESRFSSETSSHGVEKDGKMLIETKKMQESANRLNVDGNVVASSSRNVENESSVESAGSTEHVRFIDSKDHSGKNGRSKDTRNKEVTHISRPGDSSWDGKFVYEKANTPRAGRSTYDDVRSTNQQQFDSSEELSVLKSETSFETSTFEESSSSTSTVVRNVSTTSVDESSFDRMIYDTTDFTGDAARHITSSVPRRPGDSTWDGSFVKGTDDKVTKMSTNTNDRTNLRTNEPAGLRTSGSKHENDQRRRADLEISDVTEEHQQNTIDSSISSYIVEFKDAGDSLKKRVERITSVSAVIAEEDVANSPIGSSTPKRSGSPDKPFHPEPSSTSYKPGQSAWDGSFVHEKNSQRPDRKRASEAVRNVTDRRNDRVDIRDVSEDYSINEADIVTTSYIIEHSSSQQSMTDVKDTSTSSITRETIVHDDRDVLPSRGRSQSPETIPKERVVRTMKPGSSTWDGTFKYEENIQDKRMKDVSHPEHPAGKPSRIVSKTGRRNVSDSSIDIRDVHEETSEIVRESIIVEQSTIHESYTDSTNLDLSTTSVETVIIRDGTPKPSRKITSGSNVRDDERSASPDIRAVRHPDEKAERPSKPGSSTWDGSFVFEKNVSPTGPSDARRPPGKHPEDIHRTTLLYSDVVDRTSEVVDVTKNVSTLSEFTSVEKSFDSQVDDSSRITSTVHHKIPDADRPKQPSDVSSGRPQHPDKAERPLKPGSSTWDGSFVYEKPVDKKSPKPGDVRTAFTDGKDQLRSGDIGKPPKHPRGPHDVDYTTSSSVHDVLSTVSSTTEFINVEKGRTSDLRTSDSTNVTTTTSRDVPDRREPVRIRDGSPSRVPKDIDRLRSESPVDRSIRPTKPGSSTWDGSFVYEKTSDRKPQKPGDEKSKPVDGKKRPGDVEKLPKDDKKESAATSPPVIDDTKHPRTSVKDVVKHPRGPHDVMNYDETSSSVSNTVKSTTEFINVESTSTSDLRTSDTSNISTTILRDIPDRKGPEKITDGSPVRGPKVTDSSEPRGRPTSPEKSPTDRSERPQKPGSSTWDGSFVYEKPQDSKKPETQDKKSTILKNGKPASPIERKDQTPRKPHDKNGSPGRTVGLKDETYIKDITDINDITNITDTVISSEVVQHSSYVIDQSSSFTSVTDIKNVIDERVSSDVISSFTRDVVSRTVFPFI